MKWKLLMNVFPFEIKKEIFTFIRLSLAVWFELGGNVICKRFIPTPHFFFFLPVITEERAIYIELRNYLNNLRSRLPFSSEPVFL